MFELWINEQTCVAGANPWGDGCYDLWSKCKLASAWAYGMWNQMGPAYFQGIKLNEKQAMPRRCNNAKIS